MLSLTTSSHNKISVAGSAHGAIAARRPQLRRPVALWFRQRDAAHEVQQRLGTLSALRAAAAGGVDAGRRADACGGDSLLHLAVSQSIAETDVHWSPPLPAAG